MKIAIIFIGIDKYFSFFKTYYNTFNNWFLPEDEKFFFVFSDQSLDKLSHLRNVKLINIPSFEWPYSTLLRFHFINDIKRNLKNFDWMIYIDADFYVNQEVTRSEFLNPDKSFFGVFHPWFLDGSIGPFEENPNSNAYFNEREKQNATYYQGCLWGGKIPQIFNLIERLKTYVNLDLENNIIPVWEDESYLNRFFFDNKNDVHILSSSYAFPEGWNINLSKKLIHINNHSQKIV